MAIKTIAKIVLYEQLDQDKITALLAGDDTIAFEIERRYILGEMPEMLTAILPTQFEDVSIDYVAAFKNIIDAATWVHEEAAIMFKVNYNSVGKEFDLTSSYVRNIRDTSGTLTAITTGQLLEAVFITPGLDGPVSTVVSLPYNEIISLGDFTALQNVGLTLIDDALGSLFSFAEQKVPYKVIFRQPASEILEKYSIEFELQNKTIEV